MIQSVLTTILPMLAASLIMLGGGFRLALTPETKVVPHNREQLLEFSYNFSQELTRLESLYQIHLKDLSELHREEDRLSLESAARNLEGVDSIYLFRREEIFTPSKAPDLLRHKKILIETNSRSPHVSLSSSRNKSQPTESSIQLPSSSLEDQSMPAPSWLSVPSRRYQAHFYKPSSGLLVAIVVNHVTTHRLTCQSLAAWMKRPSQPLAESGERILVKSTLIKSPLLLTGSEQHGPAAAFIPFRSPLGDFEIMAWDGVTTKTTYNPVILASAIGIALFLNLIGFFLFVHQRRATKLASERVSFVNQVSHELGTPLTNLNLNLDLADEFVVSDPHEAKKRLALVKDELVRLSRLVGNVLTFSQQERNKLEITPEPSRPEAIIGDIVETFRPILERSGFEISADLQKTPEVLLAPDALCQILTNLISNVEKYAHSGQKLHIAMTYQNEMLRVLVSDDGPGIPESQHAKIFEPFQRLSQKTTEGVSGVGLGLTISRELAAKMGGELKLVPQATGATFELIIPAPLVS